jgi:glycerol-3-phosphate acyltransferase PlsY
LISVYLPILIAAVVGYFLGALPFGYLVARAHGVDIFKAGSGNPGATNVKRVLGARAGNTVYVFDALKGAVAAGWPLFLWWQRQLLLRIVIVDGEPRGPFPNLAEAQLLGIVGVIAAVLGHSFSCFTRFKGGKGVATASGGLFVLMPIAILIGVAVWFVTFFASRYASLASILASIAVLTAAWALGLPLIPKIVVTLLGALVIARHHSNIRRLLTGTEHRWERRPKGEAP